MNPRRVFTLVARRGLSAWLSEQSSMPTWVDGDWSEDAHGLEFTYRMCPRRLRVETSALSWIDWQQRLEASEREGTLVDWIFSVEDHEPRLDQVLARYGCAFLLRIEMHNFEPVLEIGTVLRGADPVWEPLSRCVYTPERGLVTSVAAELGDIELPLPTASLSVPTERQPALELTLEPTETFVSPPMDEVAVPQPRTWPPVFSAKAPLKKKVTSDLASRPTTFPVEPSYARETASLQEEMDRICSRLREELAEAETLSDRARFDLSMATKLRARFDIGKLGFEQIAELDGLIAQAISLRAEAARRTQIRR